MSRIFDNKEKEKGYVDKGLATLLFIAVALIPLIVSIEIVPVGKYEYNIIRASDAINDMFSYHKAVAICVIAAATVAYMLLGIVLEEKRAKLRLKALPCYILYTYLGLCLLSAICSPYKSIAFLGISERYEGMLVLLSYGVLFLCAMAFTANERSLKYMLAILLGAVLFEGTIAALQTFGIDFFATTRGSQIVLGKYYAGENLSLKFESAYGTLYNPNCLGMYCGMMSCFTLIPTLMLPFKSKAKYAFGLMFALAFTGMLGSDSVGGLLGFGAGMALAALVAIIRFFAFKLYKNKVYLGLALVLCLVAVGGPALLLSTNTKIVQKADIIMAALRGELSSQNPYFYEDFTFEGNTAHIVTKAGTINLTETPEGMVVEENGSVRQPFATTPMEDVQGAVYAYRLDGLDRGELQVYQNRRILVCYDHEENETRFLMGAVGDRLVPLEKFGKELEPDQQVSSIGFKGLERVGSGRGYIWSRSIPLLLNNLVIGKGPDSFALQFPQHDIVAKLKYLGNPYIIVDKPHSLYLQNGINTGVLSLLALIALVALYVVQTIARLAKEKGSPMVSAARLALCAAVVAYMAAGLTTDSVVSVAPVFWAVLGAGYGLNYFKLAVEENGKA